MCRRALRRVGKIGRPCWTSGGRFAKRPALDEGFFRAKGSGRIAQLVEQLTLNQRVPGSSPGAPTKLFRHLASQVAQQADLILQVILQFCSRFELQHRSFGELNIATQVMRVENGFDVLQRVTGYGRNLRHTGASDGQPNHRRAAQVMKRQATDAGALAGLCPRRAKAVGRPGPA